MAGLFDKQQGGPELQSREQVFSEMLDLMPDSAVLADAQRRILYVNAAFSRLTGYQVSEVLGRSCQILQGSATDAGTVADMRRALEEGRGFKGVLLNYRKDGSSFWNEVSITPVFGAEHRLSHFIGIQHDLSERLGLEEKLMESEQRFRRMADQAPVLIWLADAQGHREFVNATWLRFTGRSETQERGLGWLESVHPEDRSRVQRSHEQLLERREPLSLEYRLRRADGAFSWVFAQWRPLLGADGRATAFIGCCLDVTETRQAREERGLIERRLQEARRMESLGLMAGGIAHDFNNLLTGILGHQSLASLDVEPGTATAEHLAEIQSATLKAADLCRQMLAYSGHGRFMVQQVNLSRQVEEQASALEHTLPPQVSLRLELSSGLPMSSLDLSQLRQLVSNLVCNAAEAFGEHEGHIILRTGMAEVPTEGRGICVLEARHPGLPHVFLEVIDDGPGISSEDFERIFEPFYTTKFMGRGLGLPAVLGIVRGHGGELRVHTVPGHGTAIRCAFPCAPEPGARLRAPAWKGSGRVLVVDDEQSILDTMQDMLELIGFEVSCCNTGADAVRLFTRNPDEFALVLLDLTMPDVDGVQVLQSMRRARSSARILIVSGFGEEETMLRFLGNRPSGYLQKPFDLEKLRSAARLVMEPEKRWRSGTRVPFGEQNPGADQEGTAQGLGSP